MSDHLPQHRLIRVEQLVFERPWAILPAYLDAIAEIVTVRVQGGHIDFEAAEGGNSSAKAQVTMLDGMAIVPIHGVLMRRAAWFDKISGATDVGQIQRNLRAADESDAKVIVLDIDSPGGQPTGMEETADMIYEMRQSGKTVLAFADNLMASAAYWLGSQADEVIATTDAEVGSVGVIARVLDTSRYERNVGLDMHVMKTGEFKAIGAGPVTERQLDVIREMRDEIFGRFVAAVERGRERKTADEVLTGRTYLGSSAIAAGLVDATMTFDALRRKYGQRT
jgi:signal peptide peptidase SppA